MNVLIACEFSGVVRDAFIRHDHEVLSCDLLPAESPGPHHQGSVLEILDKGWDMMIAFPPCTHLANSGARWFPEKQADGRQQGAVNFFMCLANAPIPKICIENPIGIMSTKFRKPDQIIQPWQFGHGETKSTCLWLRGLKRLEPTNYVARQYGGVSGREQRTWKLSPTADRWKKRSRTLQGIADAMAYQWSQPSG